MEVIEDYPPNINQIRAFLPAGAEMVYAWGNKIYNPGRCVLDEPLLVHEATHSIQQAGNPKAWWDQYLVDPVFRLAQEIPAYKNQYEHVCKLTKERNRRARFLFGLAADLSGPKYGSLLSYQEALREIRAPMPKVL